jgi:hypothetical protein
MAGATAWQLYWTPTGNPKHGEIISGGTIGALAAGECQVLTYNPNGASGNYMFKAYQRLGHPGKGELWSEACELHCTVDHKAPASAVTLNEGETQTPDREIAQDSDGFLTVVVGTVENLVSNLAGFVQNLF